MVSDIVTIFSVLTSGVTASYIASQYFYVRKSNTDLWKGRSMTTQRELKRIESVLEKPAKKGFSISKLLSGDIDDIVAYAEENPELVEKIMAKIGPKKQTLRVEDELEYMR